MAEQNVRADNWHHAFQRRLRGQGWAISSALISAIVLAPIVSLVVIALGSEDNIWPHLLSTVLPGSVMQTLMLMAGVGCVTLIIGTGTAWLVTMYQFPGRRAFEWLLLIPLAMPTYIIAFCYVELWDYSGWVQTPLRAFFGWTSARDYWFPEIRSLGGAVTVMSFVLYPYVYLTARASFQQQSICVLEVARTLGRTSWGAFYSVGLPLARPALAAGVTLALMECINDIGAVEYLGVNTLTVSVYTTWLERSSLPGAAQLACVMLVFVFALLWVERASRRGQQFHHTTGRYRDIPEAQLSGWRGLLAAIFCAAPIVIGFLVPSIVLVDASWVFWEQVLEERFWWDAWHSLMLAGIAALIAVCLGLVLSYARRVSTKPLVHGLTRLASIGYAVPGTVLAVGIIGSLTDIDSGVNAISKVIFGISFGLILTGSAAGIIFAYTVRFLAISQGAIESGLTRISPNLDYAARTLGRTSFGTLCEIHLPLIRPALAAAAILVFVDSMKELPATLLLRPFNFDTLATRVYTLASLDLFEESALAALAIVMIGLLPVIVLHRTLSTGRAGHGGAPRP